MTRLAPSSTGGSAGTCSGMLSVDFNLWAASGGDPALVAGQTVWMQAWYRDPGFAPPEDVGLSLAITFTLKP